MADPTSRKPSSPVVRAVVDYAGLAAFMAGYLVSRDFLVATGALVAASAAALLAGFVLERRVALLPLLSGGAALVFGGLTLIFHDKTFVQIKPTIINLALAAGLLVGLALRKNPLKALIGEQIKLTDAGWRRVTLRYAAFFVAMAGLNEGVRRGAGEGTWIVFRSLGLPALAVVFSLLQIPLMLKEGKVLEAAARALETQE